MLPLLALALAACTSGSGATSPPTQPPATPAPTATAPTASPSPPPAATPGASGTPIAIDPCSLLTNDQASAVNGVTYGDGVAHDMENGGVECVWQSASAKASVTVQVVSAGNATKADADYVQALAALQGFATNDIPGVGDKAVIARASVGKLHTGGIYVRAGSVFYDVVYLQGKVPNDGVLKLAATLVLGALPDQLTT
jgi:hypothetical protein